MHVGDCGNVPVADVLIERRGSEKYSLHCRNRGDVPPADVLIEGGAVLESLRHVRHRRSIPIADVTVGGVGIRLVGKPQVDCGLEVGVGDHDMLPPVVRPVRIGGEGCVDFSFVGVGEGSEVEHVGHTCHI